MGPSLVRTVPGSIRYAIRESAGRRRLTLEAAAAPLTVTHAELEAIGARAVLLAPVAGELAADSVFACRASPVAVAALQGWLRSLEPGKVVRPQPVATLARELAAVLGDLDALVASEEDLAAAGSEPVSQLVALRGAFGPRPLLVVTSAAEGAWVDDASRGRHHVPAPHRLDGISTIGAGDALAAFLTVELLAGHDAVAAATAAVSATTSFLAALTA